MIADAKLREREMIADANLGEWERRGFTHLGELIDIWSRLLC